MFILSENPCEPNNPCKINETCVNNNEAENFYQCECKAGYVTDCGICQGKC